MKFGGTSLGDAGSIGRVVGIVRDQLAARPVVVVSAHAGVTDALLAAAQAAAHGVADVAAIRERHLSLLRELGLPDSEHTPLLDELRDLVRAIRLVGEASPKALDAMASFGERLSARTVALALQQAGIEATAVDAFSAGLRTDSAFGRARPLPDDGRIARSLAAVRGVPVVTGFVAADEHGEITTLGRNGSDLSAALFASALGAEEIQIWKDVDGVRTADPRLVPDALPIRRMSFADVADLASFGSKVLHPASMVPAMQRGIPVRVRNTAEPQQEGTLIAADVAAGAPAVHAIAHKAQKALVTVVSQRLLPQHAFLQRVFGELDALGCDVGPVTVAEAAVTFAIDELLADAVQRPLAELGETRVLRQQAVVGVIGNATSLENGGIADVLAAVQQAGIPVRCVGQGARGTTVALVVDEPRLADTVRLLHQRFFAAVRGR
ncbi:MAG: aspartate kinase [Planctomycetota bacterium]